MNRLFKLSVTPIFTELNIYPGAHTFVSSTGMSSAPSSPITTSTRVPDSSGGFRPQQVGFPALRPIETITRRPVWDDSIPTRDVSLSRVLYELFIRPVLPKSGYRFRVKPGHVPTSVQG